MFHHTREIAMSKRIDIAEDLFSQGFNCAQSVFAAYASSVGIKTEDALRIATGFGAGLGRQQEVCGAVTGACMAIGAKHGMVDPGTLETKEQTYALVNEFVRKFRELHGAILCFDLLGCDMRTEEGRNTIASKKLHSTVCVPCVRNACAILEEILPGLPDQK
jgi:C_GCAxxG_C_C family probable redox protein